MSILIKGMEMPKSCNECHFAGRDNVAGMIELTVCELTHGYRAMLINGKMESCPLQELPPHGDLIDRDAFKEYECHHCDGYCDVCECDCLNCKSEHRCSFMQEIDDAPTIIESEVNPISEEFMSEVKASDLSSALQDLKAAIRLSGVGYDGKINAYEYNGTAQVIVMAVTALAKIREAEVDK